MFKLTAPFKPTGDQPEAIDALAQGLHKGLKYQTLLGVTGSGKTFSIANVIARVNRPTIIISHNKTLAAQLYGEFRQFFKENAVEYFISYYDYYQPEAYVPQADLYIEKDASINEEIERLRLRATSSLMEQRDVIIVASVSCIYNLGEPWEWEDFLLPVEITQSLDREALLDKLIGIQYSRNDIDFKSSTFRVRGDVVEIRPPHRDYGIRIEFLDNTVDRISIFDPFKGDVLERRERIVIYPAKHFLTKPERVATAMENIEQELEERVKELLSQGKLLEAERLKTRTKFDLEMIKEVGYCSGIENYSRHLSGRKPGERPYCLLDYFPKDYLMIIDESHATVPQLEAMYNGDRSRKENLVEYGFRLPSCLDNRPLKFGEFESLINQVIFTSATPRDFEIERSGGKVVEQVVRPTGLVDPPITVKPTEGQIDDLIDEIKKRVEGRERTLVTTLTKRMAEDLAEYLAEVGIRVKYMHSEIGAIERVDILRGLRLGDFDVLVGVNLLREGLDLPEVSLVTILDADKEGFLRHERALIQTAGRAARNINGEVIMYGDNITESMHKAIWETDRRRKKQIEYNKKHNIIPKSITKSIDQVRRTTMVADAKRSEDILEGEEINKIELLPELEKKMAEAVSLMEFEKAAVIRDRIRKIRNELDEEVFYRPRKNRRKKGTPGRYRGR